MLSILDSQAILIKDNERLSIPRFYRWPRAFQFNLFQFSTEIRSGFRNFQLKSTSSQNTQLPYSSRPIIPKSIPFYGPSLILFQLNSKAWIKIPFQGPTKYSINHPPAQSLKIIQSFARFSAVQRLQQKANCFNTKFL